MLEMGCAGANESIAFFFGKRMLENGRGEERENWLLQEGLLLEKIERKKE